MWLEATRIGFIAVGALLAVALFVVPRLACRYYAEALAGSRDRAAGLWAFVAAGGGSAAARSRSSDTGRT